MPIRHQLLVDRVLIQHREGGKPLEEVVAKSGDQLTWLGVTGDLRQASPVIRRPRSRQTQGIRCQLLKLGGVEDDLLNFVGSNR